MGKHRICLTDDGREVRGLFKDLGLDFELFTDACVVQLEAGVREGALPPDDSWVEVPEEFVLACEERGVEPGRLLSAFMVDCMNTLPEPTSGVAAAQGGEGVDPTEVSYSPDHHSNIETRDTVKELAENERQQGLWDTEGGRA